MCRSLSLVFFIFIIGCSTGQNQKISKGWNEVRLNVDTWYNTLTSEFDTDKDQKITIHDSNKALVLAEGIEIEGIYAKSIIMQELAKAKVENRKEVFLSRDILFENPVIRTSRMIKENFWDGLIRRIDASGIEKTLTDSKLSNDKDLYIYVPYSDIEAFQYFKLVASKIKKVKTYVTKLPKIVTPRVVRNMDRQHGILTLALRNTKNGIEGVPFVVPGGRFNEMYGWDSYFIILGLLEDERIQLAKDMVDNLIYQIKYYGKILNANRSYYLTRSQPPFTTSAINAVYQALPQNADTRSWYRNSMKLALKEYKTVWMANPRLTDIGLSRYYGEGIGPCPEVESGHYDHVLRDYALKEKLTPKAYLAQMMDKLHNDTNYKMPEALAEFFVHDRAVRESGHDTTNRFDGRTADFVTVDLNSLLGKYELDFMQAVRAGKLDSKEFGNVLYWEQKVKKRKELILKYFWDEEKNMFFDYDYKNYRKSKYVSATSLYPLWAGLIDDSMARDLVQAVLAKLEQPGGISSSDKNSRGVVAPFRPQKQWDFPNGWAPHQILIWSGLARYHMNNEKDRLIIKWLTMITNGAKNYNGMVPEKYDVEKQTHQVFAEYGNVGTDFSYITHEGFGWMNASFQIGLNQLNRSSRQQLLNSFEITD